MPQKDKNVILCLKFYAFWGQFSEFLKILHEIWKILIFLPQISYFMTYHSKRHNTVSKFNMKLYWHNFCPFWTPVNFLKLKIFPTNFFLIGISGLYTTPFVLGNHCHSCFLTLPILKNDKVWYMILVCEISVWY